MLQRLFVCGILLYAAAAIDVGLPPWLPTPVRPSFLDLLLILLCLSLQGGELVAWAGAIGLYQDFAAGRTPGFDLMLAATLALILSAWRPASRQIPGFLDRLIHGAGMLLLLGTARGVMVFLTTGSTPVAAIVSAFGSRAAATFLFFVLINSLWSGVRYFGRRSYHLENSCA